MTSKSNPRFASGRKISLIVLDSEMFDHASFLDAAFREAGYDVELTRIEHFKMQDLDTTRLRKLRTLIAEKSRDSYVIFCPGLVELYIKGAAKTLNFSAYRNWHSPETMRIMPHVWTIVEPHDVNALIWTEKPPLRVGFMGTAYASSKLANLVMRSPNSLKSWFLRGSYLKYPGAMALFFNAGSSIKYINTFPRFEMIQFLKSQRDKYTDIEFDLVDNVGFAGTTDEKSIYIDHLIYNTYILCPRGSENFSFRVYEALKFGRVPVIIDTDMVQPKEIDWVELAVRIPYEQRANICEIIRQDYNSRAYEDFARRQRAALSTMAELKTMRWIKDMAREVVPFAPV